MVYTDGACSPNPGPGGCSAVLLYEKHRKEIAEGYRLTSTLLTITYRHITRQTAYGFALGTHVLLDRLEAQQTKNHFPIG